jgi:2-octaprenyl-6-methoxyphenol hydroxylase
MHTRRYILPRLALIGDSAHACHPVGGQGLNMGIRDAAVLAQVLRSAHQTGEDIGNLKVLKRYERWRRPENLAILGFTDFLDRLFSNHWLPLVVLRRLGLRIMRSSQPFRVYTLKFMAGLNGRSLEVTQPR